MSADELREQLEALRRLLPDDAGDPTGVVAVLINETLQFRDRLKETTGEILTVADTRAALDALKVRLQGQPSGSHLTSLQGVLLQTWLKNLRAG